MIMMMVIITTSTADLQCPCLLHSGIIICTKLYLPISIILNLKFLIIIIIIIIMFILQRNSIQKQYTGLLNNAFITGVLNFFPKKNKSQFRSTQNCSFIMFKKY